MKKWRKAVPGIVRRLALAAVLSILLSIAAFASETGGGQVDVSAEMLSSFQSTADTMIKTIMATVPIVMSVMSAFLFVRFGINFFKRFAK